MLNIIFFTIVFFILDHFFILLIFNLVCLKVMKSLYKIWRNELRPSDERYLSFIILMALIILLSLFLMVIIYVLSIFIVYFDEIGKFTGKW
jgi:uncharacterized BrkB/YihY/UPF0761 family membrane protein